MSLARSRMQELRPHLAGTHKPIGGAEEGEMIRNDAALLAIKREVSRLDYEQQEDARTLRVAVVLDGFSARWRQFSSARRLYSLRTLFH
jgi:hypothetical protein